MVAARPATVPAVSAGFSAFSFSAIAITMSAVRTSHRFLSSIGLFDSRSALDFCFPFVGDGFVLIPIHLKTPPVAP